jgi:hypothetical protein
MCTEYSCSQQVFIFNNKTEPLFQKFQSFVAKVLREVEGRTLLGDGKKVPFYATQVWDDMVYGSNMITFNSSCHSLHGN